MITGAHPSPDIRSNSFSPVAMERHSLEPTTLDHEDFRDLSIAASSGSLVLTCMASRGVAGTYGTSPTSITATELRRLFVGM